MKRSSSLSWSLLISDTVTSCVSAAHFTARFPRKQHLELLLPTYTPCLLLYVGISDNIVACHCYGVTWQACCRPESSLVPDNHCRSTTADPWHRKTHKSKRKESAIGCCYPLVDVTLCGAGCGVSAPKFRKRAITDNGTRPSYNQPNEE